MPFLKELKQTLPNVKAYRLMQQLFKENPGLLDIQPDMPESAIESGCIDFVLSPEDIARDIVRISHTQELEKGIENMNKAEISSVGKKLIAPIWGGKINQQGGFKRQQIRDRYSSPTRRR